MNFTQQIQQILWDMRSNLTGPITWFDHGEEVADHVTIFLAGIA